MGLFRWATATGRRKAVFAAFVVLAVPVAVLAWWLGSPLFLDKTVDEDFPQTASATIPAGAESGETGPVLPVADESDEGMLAAGVVALKTGMFRDEDTIHRGSGMAAIYSLEDGSEVLRLEDFDVTNGPDLFVLLMVDPEGRDRDQGYVNLGALKGNRGNQNYDIPADVDTGEYHAVMIYCRAFSVVFSTAPLADNAA